MTDEEFEVEVEGLIEQIGELINGKSFWAVQCALAELIFHDIDDRETFMEVVEQLNSVGQMLIDEGFRGSEPPRMH